MRRPHRTKRHKVCYHGSGLGGIRSPWVSADRTAIWMLGSQGASMCVCARACMYVCMCVCVCVRWFVPHWVWFFCDPMDCSPPGSSVHRISQARILEWVAISSSSGSSQPRGWTCISCAGRRALHHWAIRSGIKGQGLEGTEQEDSYKVQSLSLAFSLDVLKKVMNEISWRVSYTLPTPSTNENAISLSFPCRKGYQKWFERGAPA